MISRETARLATNRVGDSAANSVLARDIVEAVRLIIDGRIARPFNAGQTKTLLTQTTEHTVSIS